MSRGRLAVLGAVVLALVVAVAVRSAPGPDQRPAAAQEQVSGASTTGRVAALRHTAALAPCPAGLGPELPDLVLACLGGGPDVRLRQRAPGVPTLVNVYGSWCGPCQEEMPTLVRFAGLAGQRVALVGIDTEDEQVSALAFARDLGQHWPALEDPDKLFLPHYAAGPPVTLFLDAAGHLVHVQSGAFRGLPELQAAVARYLGVRV